MNRIEWESLYVLLASNCKAIAGGKYSNCFGTRTKRIGGTLGERRRIGVEERESALYRETGGSPRNNLPMNGITGGVQCVLTMEGIIFCRQFEYVGCGTEN